MLAVAYATYAVMAIRTYDEAAAAHRSGDCAAAASNYERVSGIYTLAFTARRGEAERRARECRQALEAEQLAADGRYSEAADIFSGIRRDFSDSPIRDRYEQRQAEVLLTLSDDRRANAETGGELVTALEPLERVVAELGWRVEAERALSKIRNAWAAASGDPDACRRTDNLDAFSDAAFVVDATRALRAQARTRLPDALFDCGQQQFDEGDYRAAIASYRRVVDDFGPSPTARRAATRLIDAEVAAVRSGGSAGYLPPPTVSGSAAYDEVELSIQNDSPETLEILLSGPVSRRLTVPPCVGCSVHDDSPEGCRASGSPERSWTLRPGAYDAVVRSSSDDDVNPWSGRWRLEGGYAYGHCFFIVLGDS
jgi:hypothetical protein